MKGYPKFNKDDKVRFTLSDGTYEGTIYIIDEYGTFEDPSDVSYDIMGEYNNKPCLFKHITEKLVEKI